MLYLVSTPIGNLGDITARAIEVLRSVDVVAAEDTRVTRKLFSHFAIKTQLVSYHEHSGPAATDALVRRMTQHGQSIALVTDAGTPSISDPGADLVASAITAGVRVSVVPGPTALIAALAASGLSSARFVFEGFLPRTRGTRLKKLDQLKLEERTVILYESPQRIGATLREVALAFGPERRACVARELTKVFEEFRRDTLANLAAHYAGEKTRGECVLIVAGMPSRSERQVGQSDSDMTAAPAEQVDPEPRGKELIRLLAKELGVARSDVYRMVLNLKKAR